MEISSTLLCESETPVDRIAGTTCGARGEVVITYREQGVATYSTRSQKRLKFWPVGNGENHFASGAIWDSVSEQYYAALETSTGSVDLICWKAELDGSGDGLASLGNRATLPGPIFAIFSGGQFGNQGKISKSEDQSQAGGIIIVLRNGSLHTYDPMLVHTASVAPPEGATWHAVEAAEISDATSGRDTSAASSASHSDVVLVTAVSSGKKTVKRLLQRFAVSADRGGRIGIKVTATFELGNGGERGGQVAAACLSSNGDVSLMWNDGWWENFRPNDSAPALRRKLGNTFASPPPVAQAALKTPLSKRRTPVKSMPEAAAEGHPGVIMAAIYGTGYVAVLGESQAEGLTDSTDMSGSLSLGGARTAMCLAVLDTRYGCVHLAHDVAVTGLSSGSRVVACGDEELLLSTGTQVHLVQLDLPSLTLAAVLGAMRPQGGPTGWGGLANHAAAAGARVLDKDEGRRVREPPRSAVAEPLMGLGGVAAKGKEEGGGGGRLKEYFEAREMEGKGLAVSRIEGLPWEEEGLRQAEEREAEVVQKLEAGGEGLESEDGFLKVFSKYWVSVQRRSKERQTQVKKGEAKHSNHGGEEGGETGGNGKSEGGGGHAEQDGNSDEEMEVGGGGEGNVNGVHEGTENGKGESGRVRAIDFSQIAPLMSPRLTSVAATRCLKSKLWGPLEGLIRGGQLAITDCPDLLANLIENDQVMLLDCCLGRLKDLPPSDVLSALQYLLGGGGGPRPKGFGKDLVAARRGRAVTALNLAKKSLQRKEAAVGAEASQGNGGGKLKGGGGCGKEGVGSGEGGGVSREGEGRTEGGSERRGEKYVMGAVAAVAAVEGFTRAELCLHSLVGVRREEAVVVEAVRQLDTQQVVALVRYLGKWMDRYANKLALNLAPAYKPSLPIPRLEQVVVWMGLVIDCHLARLMLSGECEKDLVEVEGSVSRFVETASLLRPILGMLGHIRANLPLPNQGNAGSEGGRASGYTVEVLSLN